MSHYNAPCIEHSILSPSGRISKRAKAAVMAREQAEWLAWFQAKYPPDAEHEEIRRLARQREMQLRHAMTLRDLANRGMSVQKFNREADRIEAEWATA